MTCKTALSSPLDNSWLQSCPPPAVSKNLIVVPCCVVALVAPHDKALHRCLLMRGHLRLLWQLALGPLKVVRKLPGCHLRICLFKQGLVKLLKQLALGSSLTRPPASCIQGSHPEQLPIASFLLFTESIAENG